MYRQFILVYFSIFFLSLEILIKENFLIFLLNRLFYLTVGNKTLRLLEKTFKVRSVLDSSSTFDQNYDVLINFLLHFRL